MSNSNPSRRRALTGITATAAAAVASVVPVGRQGQAQAAGVGPSGQYDADVVVVGGGYSGLACARALMAAGKRVLLLEARDRVGGRCWNIKLPAPFGAYTLEGGAEFIGPTQDRMYALAQQYGLSTFRSYDTGKMVSYFNGSRSTYTGFLPTFNLLAVAEVGVAIVKLEGMAKQVPPEAPWTAAKAAEWDSQSFQSWMDANIVGRDSKSLLRLSVLALLSVEPRDVSLLFVLLYARSGGGFSSLLSTTGGAQQDRIVGGSQAIALAMARELSGSILYSAPVRTVAQSGSGVVVSGAGYTVNAQHAVIAMSPWMASRIEYRPLDGPQYGALQQRLQMMQRVPMGSIWKVHCVYDRPFWRDDGLSGQVTSDAFLPKVVFDNTPPEAGAPGVLMGFIDGQDARDAVVMSPAERKRNVVNAFTAYFGAKAANPLAYTENNWQAENYSAGGPTGVFPPGVLTGYGPALRAPIGRLHWAGTETSTAWLGYMEGAVRSGERAAQEVLGA